MKTPLRLVLVFGLTLFASAHSAWAADPAPDKRDESVRRALAWLLQTMETDDWTKMKAEQQANAASFRYVAELMTAWVLEAHPEFHEFDAARRKFRDLADRLINKQLGPGKKNVEMTVFANWYQGFAALYAYERCLRDGKTHPALDRIARYFAKQRNEENAWGHGDHKRLPDFYSPTLIATSNLALFTFGAAERENTPFCRDKTSKQAVEKCLEMYGEVQHSDGGMPYGGPSHAETAEAGRTVGMLLALAALGRTDGNLFRSAAGYVLDNVAQIPDGHSCRPLHVALGALGCYILSDAAWKEYQKAILDQVREDQNADGWLSEAMLGAAKETGLYSRVCATALYAVALSADHTEVGRRLRLRKPFKKDEHGL